MLMFVNEVMSRAPVVVPAGLEVDQAERLMRTEGVDVLVVVEARVPVGLLSTADLDKVRSGRTVNDAGVRVGQICSPVVFTLARDDGIETARRLMLARGSDRVVVVDEGEPVGLISLEQASAAMIAWPPRVERTVPA